MLQNDTAILQIDMRSDFSAISWVKSVIDVKVVVKVSKRISKYAFYNSIVLSTV